MSNKKDKVILDYENKATEILFKMYKVLLRVQRKVEDEAYRKALEKIQNL